MKNKQLSVYYYKVHPIVIPEEYVNAQNKLTEAFQLPKEKEYENVFQTYGEVGLFGEIKYKNDYIFGTFAFTQTENIPPKQNKKSKLTENLNLEEDDGLGYQTSFIFDKQTNIIAIVSRRPGVNATSIENFFKLNFDLPPFRFDRITYKSSLDNFLRTSSYRKLKIKIANPTEITPLLDNKGLAVGELSRLIKEFGANKLSFEVTTTTKETLPINAVRNVVNNLIRVTTGNVQTMEVIGNDEDVEEKVFNFISNRIADSITVEITRHGEFRTREVYQQLELKFQENLSYFREIYRNRVE
ncbi:DUF6731 family protein [Snuella lapsa]|uniref:DUF4868 domain-containing protein n=1 Tax=Snuella lapsa TaxID=870481 RepID=A0ABP6Y9Z5_9FLAO